MKTKIKILQAMLDDAKKHIELCKTLLFEQNLDDEDLEFLCSEIAISFEVVEKFDCMLKTLKGD